MVKDDLVGSPCVTGETAVEVHLLEAGGDEADDCGGELCGGEVPANAMGNPTCWVP